MLNKFLEMADIALIYLPMSIPYVYGGNDIQTGVDCSGFVCEVARAAGKLDKRDLTSQGLYDHFKPTAISSGITKNSLLFYGKSTDKITHVSIALNHDQVIESGGEGREASNKGYVRIRPITWRKDLVAALHLR